jgi:glucose-1-phosphate thymidylyltransferase
MSTPRVGIILAGGSGSRLGDLTRYTPKSLLPVYDKPMIYYSLDVMRRLRIHKVVVIIDPRFQAQFETALAPIQKNGLFDIKIEFQFEPKGMGHAVLQAKSHCEDQNIAILLGDNLFHLSNSIWDSSGVQSSQNRLFTVSNPKMAKEGSVAEVKKLGVLKQMVEKPHNSLSTICITGLYLLSNHIFEFLENEKPSKRNEIELAGAINNEVRQKRTVSLEILEYDQDKIWVDIGTPDRLLEASQIVKTRRKTDRDWGRFSV